MGGKKSVVDGTIFYWNNTEGLQVWNNVYTCALVVLWLMEKLKVEMEECKHFRYLEMDIMDGEVNKISIEQSEYIKEKLRLTLVLKEKLESVKFGRTEKILISVGTVELVGTKHSF